MGTFLRESTKKIKSEYCGKCCLLNVEFKIKRTKKISQNSSCPLHVSLQYLMVYFLNCHSSSLLIILFFSFSLVFFIDRGSNYLLYNILSLPLFFLMHIHSTIAELLIQVWFSLRIIHTILELGRRCMMQNIQPVFFHGCSTLAADWLNIRLCLKIWERWRRKKIDNFSFLFWWFRSGYSDRIVAICRYTLVIQ